MKRTLAVFLIVLIALSYSAVFMNSVEADVYFWEYFEDWNDNGWDEFGTVYPESTDANYGGTYGCKVNQSDSSYHYIGFDQYNPIPDLPAGEVFRLKTKFNLNAMSGFTSGYMDYIVLLDSSYTSVVTVQIDPEASGTEFWVSIVTQWNYNLTCFQLSLDTWYEIEVVHERGTSGYTYAWITQIGTGQTHCIYEEDGDNTSEGKILYVRLGKPDSSSCTTYNIFFDGVTFSDTPEPYPEPTPTPTPTPPPAAEGTYSSEYYFRSDTYETLGISAYGLDNDYTNSYVTVNVSYPLYYGFRVWLVTSSTVSEELTGGTPEAQIYLNGSETYDSYSSTWECPETTVNLGYQALKVVVYTSDDNETWAAIANYISPVLITKKIESSTWTFTLQVEFDGGNAVYSWGDADHRSGVSGISFTEPLESEVQLWRVNSGDYIGFILASYIAVIGEAFYVLVLVLIGGVFYYRYRNFGVIAFFFSLFGGMGGLAWFLVPPWAATVVSILVIVGTSFIVWRVIR